MIDFIEESFEQITCKPEQFVSSENILTTELRKTLKCTYDFCKKEETKNNSDALPELIIENFDLEQIWQQLELQNDSILKRNIKLVGELVINKDNLLFKEEQEEKEIEDEFREVEEEEDASSINDDELQNEEKEVDDEYTQTQFKRSIVDDNFFKLDEMNKFLLLEEKKTDSNKNEGSDSDESIDMFEADSGEESEEDPDGYNKKKNPRYKDFFGTKTQQMGGEMEEMDYSDGGSENDFGLENKLERESTNKEYEDNNVTGENTDNIKSALELREERLKKKIKELENTAVSEKPWQLKGEVLAGNRPINSLLEEVLEYDVGSRPAPVITEATTMLLEDVIKQRIKDKAFDDVERKQKPVDTPLEYKKKLVLDQEKSKESLAQIYEKEYLQQKQTLQGNNDEKEEETPQLHKDIDSHMNSLFAKLDALSNFHFTPKPVAPELKIISNLPAISIEEVAPVAMTNASLLAPEEVKTKAKGDVLGPNERTSTDKKRERRKKKQKQREHANARSKNVGIVSKTGLGNKYTKEKVKKILDQVTKEKNVDKMDESYGSKAIKSSSAFFAQLQDEVTSQIKSKMKDHKKKAKKIHDAKRLKL
ncbi:hypothetical protein FQR65_LT09595 [Abscondita terminalis]|nr:hypothetical protein FQR65_LT09595 [Abscondita terminalis]